ncbi:MAG: DNA polymerase III subunit delta' [Crocinitomix sp.]|nr:DNA polymerase III subunit delta' [Crocinitomix sp.]
MLFKEVVGNQETKKTLLQQAEGGRVSHAQLFLGPEGSGKLAMAIAYSQYLLCDAPTATDACDQCPNCLKMKSLTHPDLHFSFPVVANKTSKIGSSIDRIKEWNALILKSTYFGLNQWQEELDEMGKNAAIAVEESKLILKRLSLKSYSGKYKIMIIWLPEKMNTQAANKLLKILEEPPEQTVFFLICNNSEGILPTILSRTQIVRFPALSVSEVSNFLANRFHIETAVAESAATLSQGNLNEAIQILQGAKSQNLFFDLFVKMMRAAYTANPIELMDISDEAASLDKENQKNFVKYGLHLFRESIILNYMKGELLNLSNDERKFLEKFARFINNQNITELLSEFNDAHYHLERNANSKILFSDLLIKLTKLIKKGI